MDIILLERVEKLGQIGDIVKVKAGFARNYLLPTKKAARATSANVADFKQRKHEIEAQNIELRQEAEAIAKKMEGIKVILLRAASETGQLYGSVTTRDIVASVLEDGFNIVKQQVIMDKAIKTLGIYSLGIRLHPEVVTLVSVNIARSKEEAMQQQERVNKGLPALLSDAQKVQEQQSENRREQIKKVVETHQEAEKAEMMGQNENTTDQQENVANKASEQENATS